MENLAPYQVKREAGLYTFVPSPVYAGLMIGGFGAGSAFLVYLSTVFFAPQNVSANSPANQLGTSTFLGVSTRRG